MSMVEPSIIDTNAYKIIEKDFLHEINKGLEYKFEYIEITKRSVSILNIEKCDAHPRESIRFLGAESVSWERNLFHGSGICFMGAESVSWERNLYHGSGICFMGGKLPLTTYGFMG